MRTTLNFIVTSWKLKGFSVILLSVTCALPTSRCARRAVLHPGRPAQEAGHFLKIANVLYINLHRLGTQVH